jgi:hypothetical protein
MWDGKIGMWPIGQFQPAARASANQPRGAPVWHNEKVNKKRYRALLLEKVIPSIKEKWPRQSWNDNRAVIWIQQDGAKAHITPDDAEFQQGLEQLEVEDKILLYTQPARSPDTNINDLGFFCALLSSYHGHCPDDESQIIQYVSLAYQEYDQAKINDIWLSLIGVLNLFIEHHGGNDFRLPHLRKAALRRAGQLPITLPVTEAALEYLDWTD